MSTNNPSLKINQHLISPILNRRERRQKLGREFSNKKGVQIVVFGIYKYRKVFQRIGKKTIIHSVLAHPINRN